MKIHEYQAKQLLAHYGMAVPANAGVASTPDEAREKVEKLGGRAVLKAQVHAGGRGKAGGIRVVQSPDEAAAYAGQILGTLLKTHQAPEGVRVEKLLVEEPITIQRELYAGVLTDRGSQRNTLILSTMGGMDIEAVAEEHPEAIARVTVDPATGLRDYQLRGLCFSLGIPLELIGATTGALRRLYLAYLDTDASLAEINPLALTDAGRLVAADAKMTIDDNALFRHSDLAELRESSAEDPIEAEAVRRGIQYVRLGGSVGIIGNGAGLVMATIDEVARAGGRGANFLDIGGGAKADVVRSSLEIVLSDANVRAVLVNIFGGITRCDEVAKGVLEATGTMDLRVPLVVRLAGTRAAEGAALLAGSSLIPAAGMSEAAAKAVAAAA